MEYVVSLLLSGIRPQFWMDVYQSLTLDNEIPFEVVFVGPKDPVSTLPNNTQFIKTDVKPAQCVEIASRYATGEYVIAIADDLTFARGFLNGLVAISKSYDMDKTIIIPHIARRWKVKILGKHHLDNARYPVVGLYSLMRRQVWRDLGGLDRRFRAIYYNNDMSLRFYQSGGTYVLGDTVQCVANEENRVSGMSRSNTVHDKPVLLSLWSKDGKFTSVRQDMNVQSYADKDILTINQN